MTQNHLKTHFLNVSDNGIYMVAIVCVVTSAISNIYHHDFIIWQFNYSAITHPIITNI